MQQTHHGSNVTPKGESINGGNALRPKVVNLKWVESGRSEVVTVVVWWEVYSLPEPKNEEFPETHMADFRNIIWKNVWAVFGDMLVPSRLNLSQVSCVWNFFPTWWWRHAWIEWDLSYGRIMVMKHHENSHEIERIKKNIYTPPWKLTISNRQLMVGSDDSLPLKMIPLLGFHVSFRGVRCTSKS